MPITSPVERISGPSAGSTSGNRENGSTASFTATVVDGLRRTDGSRRPSARSSSSIAPSITRVATLASGTPVALATNGTVRLARGLASITYTVVPVTAYCTLIRPRTSRRSAIAAVYASITSTTHDGSVGGGIAHAESPEWTPASSTCSMTPPMSTSPASSRTASTSTSTASSRKRSISTGRSDDSPPSRPRLPKPASSPIADASWLTSSTICIARPPST